MVFLPTDPPFLNLDDFHCATATVLSVQQTSAEEIKDHWREVLYRVVTELCWSFWQSYNGFPTADLRRYLEAIANGLP
jgi:hypothetical protein